MNEKAITGLCLLLFVFVPAFLLQLCSAIRDMRERLKDRFVITLLCVLFTFPVFIIFAPFILVVLLLYDVYRWVVKRKVKE